MNRILEHFSKSPKVLSLNKSINNIKSPIAISGLTDVGMAQIVSLVHELNKKEICIITYNEVQAQRLVEDLKNFSKNVLFFPKREIVPYDYVVENKDRFFERIEVLNKLQLKKKNIIVTTIEAVMQQMIEKNVLYNNVLDLKVGNEYGLDNLKQELVSLGYTRSSFIEGRSQFSIRGGIVDISISENEGVRIEFWGDEIDSIRSFKIDTQRSIKNIEHIKIFPATEIILEKNIEEVVENIQKNYTNIENDIEQIKEGNYISKVDKYFKCFYKNSNTILDYLSDECIICLDEIKKIEVRSKNIIQDNVNLITVLKEKNKIIPEALNMLLEYNKIETILLQKNCVYLEKENKKPAYQLELFNFKFRDVNYYKSETENVILDIKKFIKDNKKVYMLVKTEEKAKSICELLNKNDIVNKLEKNLDSINVIKKDSNIVTVSIGNLSSGIENYDVSEVVIVADNLVEVERKRKKHFGKTFKEAQKVVYSDLKIGDYIVHKTYGIGVFIGINTVTADNTTKDYIKIKYKDDDILYVPTSDLENVRKYIAGGEKAPKINRLGSKEWENTKAKVKNNLREVAKELVELYAKRKNAAGYAFSKDTIWQRQFEDNFIYVETDDQLRCIEEIKKDMESKKPMDRLLCGDVGYGKTEVAIRAAFKAIMDQKQVAYLVPTTVLAQQQYAYFKERMEEFPINVEVLNRFKTEKEQKDIVKKLKLGEIDIVIGTHRILSKDIEFKDLGLLIIDEEHRFGVKAKEKIKQYKSNIDVLTMTATPIPRTLHMSIVGIRDMSVIYEPPHNRKPVQTYVLEYDLEVIKEAIIKEIERGGQVFYLYNNIQGIEKIANNISNMIPEATVDFAHGRMSGRQIEDIMEDFIEKKINVLVCTTILESGIDIPNANTIIIENADKMGLAQLYQIRGRVGRSKTQAYAYITYKRDKLLTEVADKRLKAIKEFTEFGSGSKIAMRDLEIRGAGSLLGEIQHGHLDQVGYDTFCNLLDEVIKETQGIISVEKQEVQIDLKFTAYIPEDYIENSTSKMEVYQKIALCKTEEDIQNIIDETIDIYGTMPKELENLIKIAELKIQCYNTPVIKIAQKENKNIGTQNILFYFNKEISKSNTITTILQKYGTRIKFTNAIEPYITLTIKETNIDLVIKEIKEFLKIL